MTDAPAIKTAEEIAADLRAKLAHAAKLRDDIDNATRMMGKLIADVKETDNYKVLELLRALWSDELGETEAEAKLTALALYDLTKVKKQPGVTVKQFTIAPRPVYDSGSAFDWAIKTKPALLTLDVPKFEKYIEAVKDVDPVPGVTWTEASSEDRAQLDKDLSKFLETETK